MKKLLSALFVLALCSSVAMATVPDPTKCSVVPADGLNGMIICPDSPTPITATIYTVTVRNTDNNPIPNIPVVIAFGTGIHECTTDVPTGTTNGSGQCVITIRGGGCNQNSGACVVTASGDVIRTYNNCKSPDWDGSAADGQVNLSDLADFRTLDECHDYDNNGVINVGDLSIFAGAYSPKHSCTLK